VSETRLAAETRTEFGKGGARRTRRAGKVPAVIYGHGAEPRHISLPAHEFSAAIRNGGVNVLLTLDLEGEEQLAIPKAIQRHPIKGTFDHVDLLAVRRGEKISIDVPITVVGDLVPEAVLAQENTSVTVEAEATHLPTGFEVSVEGLEIGSQILASALELPANVTLASDPELIILSIVHAQVEAEPEGEGTETETASGEAADSAE
jgi:large subunit ribosomal protein L25